MTHSRVWAQILGVETMEAQQMFIDVTVRGFEHKRCLRLVFEATYYDYPGVHHPFLLVEEEAFRASYYENTDERLP